MAVILKRSGNADSRT